MNSLSDSSTHRPDRGANMRAKASPQLYADKVKDSGGKSCFSTSFPTDGPTLHLGYMISVLSCARDMSTSSGAVNTAEDVIFGYAYHLSNNHGL